ncbi:MAG: serine hydrolase domain-containing protein, partial [Pseudomonadota bacterium]
MIHHSQHPASRRRTRTLWAALTLLSLLPAALITDAATPLPSSTPEEVGISSERLQRVDDVLQKFVADGRASGIVTLISRHGQTVHSSAIGTMGINDPRPMAMDSLFRIMSMTKLVTAIAALQLYEEGHFHLYDPVANY